MIASVVAEVKWPSEPISIVSYMTDSPVASRSLMREPYSGLFCFRSRAFLRPSGVLVGTVNSRILRSFWPSLITMSGLKAVDTNSGGIVAWGVSIAH